MADYYSSTVVTPNIPADAVTMLELMVLTEIYEWERDGAGLYFFSQGDVPGKIQLDIGQIRELATAAPEGESSLVALVLARLAQVKGDEGSFDLDVSGLEGAGIFQDILGRCTQIDHVSIISGWTCSKMRSDGFGGAVTVISRDGIRSCSTQEMEARLRAEAKFGDIGRAPGIGEHLVLTLSEPEVRAMVTDIDRVAQRDGELSVPVTDSDIREGCRQALSMVQLDDYRQNLAFSAAQAATRIAQARAA